MTARTWHVYRLADGTLTGQSLVADDDDLQLLAANTPEGCGLATGVSDWQAQRVDLQTLEVVAWQPPAPADDAMRTWEWDTAARRWLPVPTAAAVAAGVRAERDRRLAACDWLVLRAIEQAAPMPSYWATYRQALRDLPEQPGWPGTVTWPEPPVD